MRLLLLLFFVTTIIIIPQVYGYNSLENTELHAQSTVITLDIKFGQDEIRSMLTRSIIINHLDEITLTFYGDKIPLSEPELKVTSSGNHFRISSIPEGIIMYGHKNMDVGNYKINVYLATDKGLVKFPVSTVTPLDDEKVIETEPEEEKLQYIPELLLTSSHDFRTYWKETFNIDVQAFDGRVNSDPKQSDFNGRIDGVDVKVLLSLDDIQVAALSGVTANNGHWDGEYFFQDNISAPGEYAVDVIISYLGVTVSKTSSMFVIAATTGGDSSNHAPITNAGIDQSEPEHDEGIPTFTEITLDGSASNDPDGDSITYSWIQTSGTNVTLSDTTAQQPTFTAPNISVTEDLIFELTVTDAKGLASLTSDSVTITITFVD